MNILWALVKYTWFPKFTLLLSTSYVRINEEALYS